MPLLPAGVRERPRGDGRSSSSPSPPRRPRAPRSRPPPGVALAGWEEHDGPGGLARAPRAASAAARPRRRPHPRPLALGPAGGATGAARPRARARRAAASAPGSHPTTRMCLELLLDARRRRAARPTSAAASARSPSPPPGSAGRRWSASTGWPARSPPPAPTARATASTSTGPSPTSRRDAGPARRARARQRPAAGPGARGRGARPPRTRPARHVIVSGISCRELARGAARLRRGRPAPPPRARGRRLGRRPAGARPVREDVLDPDRAAAAGAALGQLACALAGRRPARSRASRLVEFNVRAPILLAPGLFRLDLTPQEETLGVLTRPLSAPSGPLARRPVDVGRLPRRGGVAPLELHGALRAPRRPAHRLAPHPLLHRPRRRRRPLRRQGWSCACRGRDDAARLVRARARARCPGARRATRTRCSSAR